MSAAVTCAKNASPSAPVRLVRGRVRGRVRVRVRVGLTLTLILTRTRTRTRTQTRTRTRTRTRTKVYRAITHWRDERDQKKEEAVRARMEATETHHVPQGAPRLDGVTRRIMALKAQQSFV